MRRLKGIYPEYADKVGFYAVSYHTFQDLAKLNEFSQKEGFTWPVAFPVGTMIRDWGVVISSTKIAFDSRGVITYRVSMSEGNDQEFRRAFQKLAASR